MDYASIYNIKPILLPDRKPGILDHDLAKIFRTQKETLNNLFVSAFWDRDDLFFFATSSEFDLLKTMQNHLHISIDSRPFIYTEKGCGVLWFIFRKRLEIDDPSSWRNFMQTMFSPKNKGTFQEALFELVQAVVETSKSGHACHKFN